MGKPTLSLSAQSRLNELRSLGIEPTLDEILWLHETGKTVEDIASDSASRLPVNIGNVTLYPLTIGASMWWVDHGSKWFPEVHSLSDYVLAFTLAHAQAPAILTALTSYELTKTSVRSWVRTIGCTKAELDHGMMQILRPWDAPARKTEHDPDWAAYLACVAEAFPGGLKEYLWEHSSDLVSQMLRKRAKFHATAGQPPDPFDPLTIAVHLQQEAFNAIQDAHRVKTPEQVRVVNAAIALEAWLGSNAGSNADWPVHLHIDNDADAEKLSDLLNELNRAIRAKGGALNNVA